MFYTCGVLISCDDTVAQKPNHTTFIQLLVKRQWSRNQINEEKTISSVFHINHKDFYATSILWANQPFQNFWLISSFNLLTLLVRMIQNRNSSYITFRFTRMLPLQFCYMLKRHLNIYEVKEGLKVNIIKEKECCANQCWQGHPDHYKWCLPLRRNSVWHHSSFLEINLTLTLIFTLVKNAQWLDITEDSKSFDQ